MCFIELIRDFISLFDGFADKRVAVEYLNSNIADVCVSDNNIIETVRRYTDGIDLVRHGFSINYILPCGMGDAVEIENGKLVKNFELWLEEKSLKAELPKYNGGNMMNVKLVDYSSKASAGTQKINMKCSVEYFKRSDL